MQLGIHAPDPKQLVAFLKALEFSTLSKRGRRGLWAAHRRCRARPEFRGLRSAGASAGGDHQDGDFPVTRPVAPPVAEAAAAQTAAGEAAPAPLVGPALLVAQRIAEGQATVITHKPITARSLTMEASSTR